MQKLVLAARNGDPDALSAIWEAVKRLAFRIANQYRNAAAVRGGADAEDLAQCAALGVMEALQSYDPDKGTFTAWLGYHVRNACRECLGMIRNPESPLMVSLDAPVSADTEDLTIADTIPDECAAQAIEATEDALENQQLRSLIDAALDDLPDDIAVTIRMHDLDGLPLQEAADRQGIPYNTAQQRRRTGFNRLRKRQELLHWYNIPNYHRYKSLTAFKESWSSVVEDEVIRKLDRRKPSTDKKGANT